MSAGRRWPIGAAAALAVTVAANGILWWAAHGRDAAEIEPDYYRRAVAFDTTLAIERASAALGWRLEVELGPLEPDGGAALGVRLAAPDGTPVDGAAVRVSARHNRAARRPVTMALAPAGGGAYAGRLPLGRRGLWELSVRATRGADRFVAVVRRDTEARGRP